MRTDQDAVNILRLWETPGIGRTRLREILSWLDYNRILLSEFLRDTHLQSEILKPEQIVALRANLDAVSDTWKSLEDEGVQLLKANDQDYPTLLMTRLGDKSPPVLLVRGNRGIMGAQAVGFCGSRKATEKGLSVAKDTAGQLAQKGINIVSGYAAGVDLTVHEAALAAGGFT